MANSANPVLARILIDLGMMKSRLATMMMTATVVDDLVNWTLYAIILGSVTTAGGSSSDRTLAVDLLLVALLFVVVLGGVRWLAPRIVDLARRHLPWPSGYVAVVAVVLLAVSAFSEAVGVQAFLGAFLAGVAFSGVAAGPGATGQKSIAHVAIAFFAPLFFVSMALRTDFVESFDLLMVTVVLVVALAAKLISVLVGVKAAGMPVGREAWAIAWGLNARGTTGIILAATGLQTGIINDEVFVALVVMSIVTSILAGPMMLRVLGPVAAKYRVDEVSGEEPSAVVAAATRVVERDMTEHERRALERALFYRVVVAIDDPSTARPLVEFATELASSQQPAEVVLVSLKQQTEVERLGTSSFLDAIADDLGSVRDLERLVRDRGLAVVSTSQRSSDVASDIAARSARRGGQRPGRRRPPGRSGVGRHGGSPHRRSPRPTSMSWSPRCRVGEQPVRHGPPVIEAGVGLPGEASLEAGLRIALAGGQGPIVVGVTAGDGPDYQALLDRLAALDRPGRALTDGLDTIDGAATAAAARFVVRSFSAPEGPGARRAGPPRRRTLRMPGGAGGAPSRRGTSHRSRCVARHSVDRSTGRRRSTLTAFAVASGGASLLALSRPRSSGDRASASGAVCAGSNPAEGTRRFPP